MNFCFITTNRLSQHASMKRSLGMAPCLVKLGHAVTIIFEDNFENHAYSKANALINCVFFPQSNVLKERKWKRNFLLHYKYDVVIINSLCWRNAVSIPMNDTHWMEHCELESTNLNTSVLRRLSQFILEWWSLFRWKNHICASRYLLDLFRRRSFMFSLNRHFHWSPYAVDDEVAQQAIKVVSHKSRTEPKLIFHVGTVARNYGCLFMIEGLFALRKIRTDWIAKFAGKGRDLELARTRVLELGLQDYVEFSGYVPEDKMRLELETASVFLSHLNDTEQDWARCPSKLYYYMVFGRPIVTTIVGENLVALGNSGFYYRCEDPQDFARAVDAALSCDKTWSAEYTPNSVTWSHRTDKFIKEIGTLSPITR